MAARINCRHCSDVAVAHAASGSDTPRWVADPHGREWNNSAGKILRIGISGTHRYGHVLTASDS